MIFIFIFLLCTQFDVDEKDKENKNREYTLKIVATKEDKMHDCVDYNENFLYKVNECNEHEVFGPMDLKNEIIINKKTQNDIFLQDETQSNCDDPVKNLDLETSDLKKIHWFEEDIDQLQESNTANDRPIETSERKLLKELKNEIEKFRKERIFNLVTEKGPRNKNIVNKKTKGLIKKKNCDILEFKKDFIYNLKNKELKKLRKLILHAYIPADVKIVLLEIIEVFKSFIGGYKNRKNLLTKKKINRTNMVLMIRFNIEIMSIFDYIPIFEIFSKIRDIIIQRNYENHTIKHNVVKFFIKIFKHLQELHKKSKDIIKTYEECIELYEKKTDIINRNIQKNFNTSRFFYFRLDNIYLFYRRDLYIFRYVTLLFY